jgi:cytidylate kinase
MYRSIVLSGPVASGTTTAAKNLSQELNLEYHSAGDFFRDYMLKHNIPLPNKEEIPDEIDKKVDQELTSLLASEKNVVVDGLYYGYFCRNMPHILKVLITADEDERIKRATSRTHTHKETPQDVIRRDKAHDIKFRKLYASEDFLDPKFFNLVIDSTHTSQEEVLKQIEDKFKS